MTATEGALTVEPSRPLPNLVAYDDCGVELRCPHLITRRKRKLDAGSAPVTDESDTIRFLAWDPDAVVAAVDGLDPSATYELGVTYVGEVGQPRTQSIEVNGVRVDGPRDLVPGEVTRVRVPLDAGLFIDNTISVRVIRDAGPDATVSEISVWSDAPSPLIVTVVGDAAGGLFGSVSDVRFQPVADAEVAITWAGGALTLVSDDEGTFEAPIRALVGEGRRAEVTVSARAHDRFGTVTVDTASLPLGLADMPLDGRIDLAGRWLFRAGRHPRQSVSQFSESVQTTARVPGHLVYDGLEADDGVATLARLFDLPRSWSGGRCCLRFDGAYGLAEVFVNGVFVGAHEGGATSFDVDVTEAVEPGRNVISVVLTEYTASSVIDYMSWYAHMSLAGIWRSVIAYRTPHVHLGRPTILADVDPAGAGALLVRVPIANTLDGDHAYDLSWALRDRTGTVIASGDTPITGTVSARSRDEVTITASLADVTAWTAESPTLYRLEMSLDSDGRLAVAHEIGFRRIEVVANSILVNGAQVRLLGVNRHDSRRYTGRALTEAEMRSDVESFRRANVNVIRTSHYPPAPAFLDICDATGMYVLEQPPICWAGTYKWDMSHVDTHTLPHLWQVIAETFERDRNHPSVIVWDIANESAWGRNFVICLRRLRAREGSRPALFSFDDPLQDPTPSSTLQGGPGRPDIRSSHYPGWLRPWTTDLARYAQFDEPVLADEFMPIFQVCQREPHEAYTLRVDPGLRDYWVTGYGPFLDRFREGRSCAGGMVWSGIDDVFEIPTRDSIGHGAWSHLPEHEFLQPFEFFESDHGAVRGDGEWGLLDSWGRPRPELWHLQKMYSPILIVAADWIASRTLRLIVRNRFSHTPLSALRTTLRSHVSAVPIALAACPGDEEVVVLDIDRAFGSAEPSAVTLEVHHPEGWLVDAWSWDVPAPRRRARSVGAGEARLPIDVVIASDGSLTVGAGLVAAWPSLHVMDANDGSRPMVLVHDVATRSATSDGVIATATSSGGGWSGTTSISTPGGADAVEITYDYRYDGPSRLAREVGLAIPVATQLRTLWWDREAEWSYYPSTHIGRPRGVADAHPSGATAGGPGQAWELDVTPAGSNEFRSTKRRIRSAGLTDGRQGVTVHANGTQHVRAEIVGDRPVLHVLDWYGGVRTEDSEDGVWTAYFGPGKAIDSGTRIRGKVSLMLRAPSDGT